MQNNRQTGPVSTQRLILIILAIGLLVGVAVFSIFYFVVFKPGTGSTGTPTPIVSSSPGPAGPCTSNSPYGFTTIHADSLLVSAYKQLDVCWVRYQYHWNKIETSPGVYDWSQVDAGIATMNAAHIHVDFAIQSAPTWDLTQVCPADGLHYLPGPSQLAQFATVLATRYDGKHGHGYIDSYEIGNEEYDNHYVPGLGNNQPCRSASIYGPVLKAGYQAIKAVSPNALVGMFGLWWHYEPHIQDFMTTLFSNGYGQYMDYMNYHYYHSGGDPSVTNGDDPSFDTEWQTMHSIAAKYGFANKPIWITEVGWPTTTFSGAGTTVDPQTQSQYMQYILNESAKSGVVQKVFWFTIDYGRQSDNIDPPTGPLPAFTTIQTMVRQKPLWG
ncbi:MAG TPA: glycosyl hydrolase [Ktedonobacteraceae bacterium]|nr:glycosyl hydrolase [Ktedonobacteraceae bacterium]